MQLGLTIPLQRYLRIKTLEYGKPLDRRYCWDLHGITLQGRRSLLAVHCETRYTFVLFDPSPADWSDLTGAFLLGLRQSLLAAGISQERIKAHLDCAGLPEMTKTHGRREVAFLNRAWEDVMALDYAVNEAEMFQPLLDCVVNRIPCRCAGKTKVEKELKLPIDRIRELL